MNDSVYSLKIDVSTTSLHNDISNTPSKPNSIENRKFLLMNPLFNGENEKVEAFPLKRLDLLGRGSSSNVYRSIYLKNLTLCAEKVIVSADPAKRLLLLRELESLKKSVKRGQDICPNIVQLLDVVSNPTDGTLSICLEYMNGGSLQDIVDAGGIQNEVVLRGISKQMLVGLKHLHDLRVIHRDLKPSNALISSKGVVKLADFGLARTLEQGNTLADSFVGTFDYMSPERMMGGQYSFLSDVWALGLTIHATAIGQYPYKDSGRGYWALLNAIQERPVPLPPASQFSYEFIDFTKKLCAKDPVLRSDCSALLKHPFLLGMVYKKKEDEVPPVIAPVVQRFDPINTIALVKQRKLQIPPRPGSNGGRVEPKEQQDNVPGSRRGSGASAKGDNAAAEKAVSAAAVMKKTSRGVSQKVPSKLNAFVIDESRKAARPTNANPIVDRNKRTPLPVSKPHTPPVSNPDHEAAAETKTQKAASSIKKYIDKESKYYSSVQRMSCMTASDVDDIAEEWKQYVIKSLSRFFVSADETNHLLSNSIQLALASPPSSVANSRKYKEGALVKDMASIPKINLSINKLDRLGKDLGCSSTLMRSAFYKRIVEIKDAVVLAIGIGGLKPADLGSPAHIAATKKLKHTIRLDDRADREKQRAIDSDSDGSSEYSDDFDEEELRRSKQAAVVEDLGIGIIDDEDDFEEEEEEDYSDDDYED